MTLYEQMKDPLQEESLNKIIRAYTDYRDLYDGLIHVINAKKITGKYSPKYKDEFYQLMYNFWKKSILYRIKNNLVNDEYKNAFIRLNDYLKKKNPKTSEEIIDIIHGYELEDEELRDILDKIRWDIVGEFSSWNHIKSKYIFVGLNEQPEVLHRLYLNCDSTIIDQFGKEFIKNCIERKIPFYFKYSESGRRDDTIVIYSDNKYLKQYIDIIKKIRKENHLEDHFYEPPVLSSKIEDYIGYGSEPLPPKENEIQLSFNEKRKNHLERCIKKTTINWMRRNLDSKFNYNGVKTTYASYSIQDMIKMKKDNYLKYLRNQNLKEEDLRSIDFDITLRGAILNNYQSMLEAIESDKPYLLEIPYKGIILKIYKSDLLEWLRRQTKFINEHSRRYKKDLIEEIKRTAKDYEIDSDNYAVDLSKKEFLSRKEKVTNLQPTEKIKEKSYTVIEESKKGIVTEKYRKMTEEEIIEARKKLGL